MRLNKWFLATILAIAGGVAVAQTPVVVQTTTTNNRNGTIVKGSSDVTSSNPFPTEGFVGYGSDTSLPITLTSLASDASELAGRSSAVVDNTTANCTDYIVGGIITTGTTPSAGTIEVWAYAYIDSTPNYVANMPGADQNFTVVANDKLQLVFLKNIPADTTANHSYKWSASLRQQAGTVPKKWGLFVDHNTVAALNASAANQSITYSCVMQ